MERRTFVQGAFGLALIVAGGMAGLSHGEQPQDQPDGAQEALAADEARGPIVRRDIVLEPDGDGAFRGIARGVHLFNVDATGAQLMRMADGSLAIEELAASLEIPADPADVASFFVTLGKAGYLLNTVLVNLVEIPS